MESMSELSSPHTYFVTRAYCDGRDFQITSQEGGERADHFWEESARGQVGREEGFLAKATRHDPRRIGMDCLPGKPDCHGNDKEMIMLVLPELFSNPSFIS